jgi:hypothetical protein
VVCFVAALLAMTHQRSEAIQKCQSWSLDASALAPGNDASAQRSPSKNAQSWALDCFVAALVAMTHQPSEAFQNASRGHWIASSPRSSQ